MGGLSEKSPGYGIEEQTADIYARGCSERLASAPSICPTAQRSGALRLQPRAPRRWILVHRRNGAPTPSIRSPSVLLTSEEAGRI